MTRFVTTLLVATLLAASAMAVAPTQEVIEKWKAEDRPAGHIDHRRQPGRCHAAVPAELCAATQLARQHRHNYRAVDRVPGDPGFGDRFSAVLLPVEEPECGACCPDRADNTGHRIAGRRGPERRDHQHARVAGHRADHHRPGHLRIWQAPAVYQPVAEALEPAAVIEARIKQERRSMLTANRRSLKFSLELPES